MTQELFRLKDSFTLSILLINGKDAIQMKEINTTVSIDIIILLWLCKTGKQKLCKCVSIF